MFEYEQANSDNVPRSLGDSEVLERRRALLNCRHMERLNRTELRAEQKGGEFPDFEPLDGGINAEALFLFEKPGPATVRNGGSGFISRNTNDATAESIRKFMRKAGTSRECTITWNVVPG